MANSTSKAEAEATKVLVLDRDKIIRESVENHKRTNIYQIYLALANNGPTYPTVRNAISGNINSTLATVSAILFDGLGLTAEQILERPLGDFFKLSSLENNNDKVGIDSSKVTTLQPTT